MKKSLELIILLTLVAGSGAYFLITKNRVSTSSPTGPLSLSTKFFEQDTHNSIRSGNPAAVKSVVVVRDEPRVLELRVVYHYDGTEGSEVSTCGGVIKRNNNRRYEWTCKPTRLKTGEHTAFHRFQLLDDTVSEYYCTDSVSIDMYRNGGSNFFNQLYNYKKAWVDDEGPFAQLKQFVYRYTRCRDKPIVRKLEDELAETIYKGGNEQETSTLITLNEVKIASETNDSLTVDFTYTYNHEIPPDEIKLFVLPDHKYWQTSSVNILKGTNKARAIIGLSRTNMDEDQVTQSHTTMLRFRFDHYLPEKYMGNIWGQDVEYNKHWQKKP